LTGTAAIAKCRNVQGFPGDRLHDSGKME